MYNRIYEENRNGGTKASSITKKMETWLHKKVASDVAGVSADRDTLEVGAGTLNQLDFESVRGRYDIVEPFADLYKESGHLPLIGTIYRDINEIIGEQIYDRITSVATFEHICELPQIIAKSGTLLKEAGTLRVAIPSEGTFLWTLGWKLTTGLEFRLKYGLDWGELIAHEHVNTAHEIEALLRYFFKEVNTSVFGISRSISFYQFFESKNPIEDRCLRYG